jgi:NAD(P)-dependent dehydrogenase (short-subunit alcohol dehydrogenase family)
MTRNLAGDLSPRGIRVNAVSPGPIETTVLQKVGMPKEAGDQVYAQMKEIVPMKRIGQVGEVANGSSFFRL